MKPLHNPTPGAIPLSSPEEIASDWVSRREAGLTAAEKNELESWLQASPGHRAAFRHASTAWRFLEKARRTSKSDEMMQAISRKGRKRDIALRRRIAGFSLAGLAAAACLIVSFSPFRQAAPPAPIPANTVVVKTEVHTLPDGSVVELNAGAQILPKFTLALRTVVLVRGEAHFAVAKDHVHPFVVTAGGVTVHAVGTAFDVNMRPDAVDVLVTEGKVRVDHPAEEAGPSKDVPSQMQPQEIPAPGSSIYLTAGERAVVSLTGKTSPPVAQLSSSDIDRALVWRSRRVEFNGASLAEAVAIFNRQNQVKIVLGDPSLGSMRLGGAFWANDPEGLVRLLQSTSGLRIERRDGGNEIVLSPP
jgi:transmembrane sensor